MLTHLGNPTAHKWSEKGLFTWTKQDPGKGSVCRARKVPDQMYSVGAGQPTTPFVGIGTQAYISSDEIFISIMGNCTTGMSRIVCVYSSCIYAVSWLTTQSNSTWRSPLSFTSLKEEKTEFCMQMRRLEVFFLFWRAILIDKGLEQ